MIGCTREQTIIDVDESLYSIWTRKSLEKLNQCCKDVGKNNLEDLSINLNVVNSSDFRKAAFDSILANNRTFEAGELIVEELYNMGNQYVEYRLIIRQNSNMLGGLLSRPGIEGLIKIEPMDVKPLDTNSIDWDMCCQGTYLSTEKLRYRPLLIYSRFLIEGKQLKLVDIGLDI